MKTVIEMAKDTGKTKWFGTHADGTNDFLGVEFTPEQLERFAALVREDEREACAKVCEKEGQDDEHESMALICAAAIRARGK